MSDGLAQFQDHLNRFVARARQYAIFLLDEQGRVVTWNAGAERLKGYRPDEIIGQHFSKFYPPEERNSGKPERELQIARDTGTYEEEGWRVRKDGSRFLASVLLTALTDDNGQVRGFLKVSRDLTAQKKAEDDARRLLQEEAARRAAEDASLEALRLQREEQRHREQLHVTLTSIGDAVIVTDTSGLVTFLNPVAQALTGFTPQEAAGQPLGHVFPIVNEETRLPVENPVNRVLREGVTVGLANHTVLMARNGREIPIDDSAAPIRGEDGSVAGVVLVFRDVTEVRRAIEARLHLAAIVESSDDAIISKTLDGTILSWNEGAERLYGYRREEMVGKSLATIVPPDHPDDIAAIIGRIKRGERVDHFETVRIRKDGSRVEVSLTVSPIKNADGKVVAASKIARDITARKRSEAALRFLAEASTVLAELEDVGSTLDKVASLAVPHFADWCTVDMVGANGGLERVAIAHADPAKVELARELQRRFPPDKGAAVGVWNVLRTGKPELMPEIPDSLVEQAVKDPELLRIIRRLGLRSYLSVPLTVRGKRLGVISFVTAESRRSYGSEDLRLAEDLAQRAAVAIENARLYSELKEADRRKDEWIAMLAHELRNPLAPIRNALHIMKMPGAQADAIERARQVTERQVQHMVRLVDDLLDVSRIMRGRIELRKEPIDLVKVIATAVETAQPMIDAQGQELTVSVPPESLHMTADAARLTQVLGNLLNNAAKFSERAGRIWLSAERQGSEAVLRVRDEGAGIPPELLPRIFELFVQGDRSMERSQGGLGIGLTVVRRLVELHGGTISVHSEGLGKGSEFVVRLPGLKEPGAGGAGDDPAPSRKGRRVLVVDDNVDAAESVAVLLRQMGHEVRLAHNGPEALQAAAIYQPEAVVLDIGLPGMNGYEVALLLRQDPRLRDARLIAMTGYGHDEDRRRSRQAGFNEHLVKPIDPQVLERAVARVVE